MTESLESQAALLTGQLEAVRRLSTLAVAPLDRDELLEKILDTVLDVAGAEAGSLAFVDPDTEQLQFAVVRGPAATTLKDVVLEPGEGIIGWSVQHRQPAIVPDTSTDERFAPRVDQLVQFVTRSVVVCPMVLPDRVIGAIELVNKRGLPSFTQPDADLLQTAATAAALVVDNCRLKAWATRKVDELSTLVELERQLNATFDPKRLLCYVIESAVRAAGGEAGSLLLVDREIGDLYFEVATGKKAHEVKAFRVPVGSGVAGWVAAHKEPLLVVDVDSDPRFDSTIAQSLSFDTRSLVAVPMLLRDQVLGVIEVINIPPRIASRQEYLNVMMGFAGQAASALERAHLYEQLENRVASTEDELREAYAELHHEKKRMEAMIESLADGIVVVDPARTVILVNRAALGFLGMAAETAPEGRKLSDLPSSGFLEPLFDEAARQPWEVASGETRLGDLELSVNATQVLDDGGRPVGTVGVLTDITHFKELNRLKTELLGIVSHELRSPLTSLKAVAATMLHDRELDESTETEFLEIMDDQCDRMNRMIGDLLNASRIDSGRDLEMTWEDVDVVGLVNRTVSTMRLAAARHDLRVMVPPSCPAVRADSDKLQQVLTNLLDNALKYSNPGSAVTVTLTDHEDRVELTVADEGVGIPESEVPKLFRMFERTRGKQTKTAKGTGVGLYLCKHLVEAHGGSIAVDSMVGRGTTFLVTIPRSRSTEPECTPQ